MINYSVRVLKDLTDTLFYKMEPSEKETEYVEIEEYRLVLLPTQDDFLYAFNPTNFSFNNLFIECYIMIRFSSIMNFFETKKAEIAVKSSLRKTARKRKAKIRENTRSYKRAFLTFNYSSTFYETDERGIRRRENIRLPKQRFF